MRADDGAPGHHAVRTSCGRILTVGRLRLDGLGRGAVRVTLDVKCESFDRGEVWASLTYAEARELAAALLAHADAAEREGVG